MTQRCFARRVAALSAILVAASVQRSTGVSYGEPRCANTTAPEVIALTRPTPPPEFWGTREDHVVVLELLVDRDGTHIFSGVSSTPGRNYTKAAVAAMRDRALRPGTCDGQPIQMPLTVTVSFEHDRDHI